MKTSTDWRLLGLAEAKKKEHEVLKSGGHRHLIMPRLGAGKCLFPLSVPTSTGFMFENSNESKNYYIIPHL